jgi:hypothetical protein
MKFPVRQVVHVPFHLITPYHPKFLIPKTMHPNLAQKNDMQMEDTDTT